MEEDEEEEGDDDNMIIRGFAEYGAFDDTAMGEAEEEVAAEEEAAAEDEPDDDLGQAIRDAQRECESEKEKIKFESMLEDHKKLYTRLAKRGKKSWVPHLNCCNGRQRMVYLTRDLGSY